MSFASSKWRSLNCPGIKCSSNSDIATAKAAADRVIDIRDGDNETLHEMMWRQASSDEFTPDVEKAVEVRFHQVWFSYAGRPMPVLKGLNIEV